MKRFIERGTRIALPPALLLAAIVASAQVAPTAWKESLYNPKPAPDDLILPLPCEGAMAFRRIVTTVNGPLADTAVEVGSDAEAQGYVEHRQTTYLAGAFESPEGNQRQLLMGKYEVTTLQYEAVMATANAMPCPSPTARARLPRTGVGWHDSVAFTHQYSLWLRRHAADIPACSSAATPCLPRADQEPAFVRLPTEVEWEYATRGGEQVSPANFRELHYPMPEGLERHVWFNETAQGQVRPIGVLAANPVGLHDVLGNVEEVVLDPFRLHRLDRPHGQAGGYVVRGGSIHSTREEVRASLRREVAFYDDRGATATPDTGFRVVLSAPVLTSKQRIDLIRAAWEGLGSDTARTTPAQPARPQLEERSFEDPVLELTALARSAEEPVLKQRLERLRGVVASSAERLYEQRARSARETLRFGGVLCQKLADEGHNLMLVEQRHAACIEGNGADHPRCKQLGSVLTRDNQVLDHNIGFYADSVIRTAQTYPEDLAVLDQQMAALGTEFSERGYGDLAVYPGQFHKQVLDYAQRGRVEQKEWFNTCRELRQ